MKLVKLEIDPIESDPDLQVGEMMWLERSDGRRPVWRQRLVVRLKSGGNYSLSPVDWLD